MIDVHSHFFNLKYLPVAGIIRRYSRNIVPHVLAIGAERLLLRKTNSSISLPDEPKNPFGGDINEISVLKKYARLLPDGYGKNILDLTDEENVNRILNRISESDLADELVINALEVYQTIEHEAKTAPGTNIINLSDPNLSGTEKVQAVHMAGRLLRWIAGKMIQGINYLRWFSFMQNSERDMLNHLRTYDEPGVKKFVHQLMDVDYYFNKNSKPGRYTSFFPYDVQIKKMEKFNSEFSDVLVGMVAFDPSKDNCTDIVDEAIRKRNFKGIKFYPPMGYKAWGDPVHSKNITRLLDYCVENDVPLFTHCNNQGFEAFPTENSGFNSNPVNWEKVLEQDKYRKLRLCLAHAGGTHGWFAETASNEETDPDKMTELPPDVDDKQSSWNKSYAKIAYKLCVKYDNVYCDAAYLDEVTDPKQNGYFKERLLRLFKAKPKFSKKIIYGSDWHMLFQEGKNARYLQDYIKLFEDSGFSQDNRDDFFVNNAKSYLKLS